MLTETVSPNPKMDDFKLSGLSLRIWKDDLDDAVLIFADPWFNQFSEMVKSPDIIKIVSALLLQEDIFSKIDSKNYHHLAKNIQKEAKEYKMKKEAGEEKIITELSKEIKLDTLINSVMPIKDDIRNKAEATNDQDLTMEIDSRIKQERSQNNIVNY